METITEITDDTTVGQIKQWIQSIQRTNPGLMPKFEIDSFSSDIKHVVGIWDGAANKWICIGRKSLAEANQAIRDYNPDQARQNKIAELKAKIAELEAEA